MVEALARALFDNGVWVVPNSGETPEQATARLMAVPGDGVWFEPTFVVNDMLVRVDILQRKDNVLRLIEVKAASFDSVLDPTPFRGKQGGILSDWRDYLYCDIRSLDTYCQVVARAQCLGRQKS